MVSSFLFSGEVDYLTAALKARKSQLDGLLTLTPDLDLGRCGVSKELTCSSRRTALLRLFGLIAFKERRLGQQSISTLTGGKLSLLGTSYFLTNVAPSA
jgi:hypothetical protein